MAARKWPKGLPKASGPGISFGGGSDRRNDLVPIRPATDPGAGSYRGGPTKTHQGAPKRAAKR